MRTVVAFLVAPLGAVAVLALLLMSSVINNKSWSGFLEVLLGFSAFIYGFYLIGLILILPAYFWLKYKRRLNRKNLLLLGSVFGALIGIILSLIAVAWLFLGVAMGLVSGYVLSLLLPNLQVNTDASRPLP